MKLYSLQEFWIKRRIWVFFIIVLTFFPVTISAFEIPITGDAGAGKELFTGRRPLTNGGPPCISCHNAGIGRLGGGTLGPDLSRIWQDKPFIIIPGWINAAGVPVMGPIFGELKVTDGEIEDLKAFFSAQAEKGVQATVRPDSIKFIGSGIAGFVSIMIVFNIIWSGRFGKRNKGTVHDELWRNYTEK